MLTPQAQTIKNVTLNEKKDILTDLAYFLFNFLNITRERAFDSRLADLRDRHCRRVDFQ
jgi:hypothetical protein